MSSPLAVSLRRKSIRLGCVVLAACVGSVAMGPACRSKYTSCSEDDACIRTGNEGGLGGAPKSLDAGGTAAGDEGPTTGSGGRAASGGTTAVEGGFGGLPGAVAGVAVLGEACGIPYDRACTATASRFPLLCEGGVWTSAGQCSLLRRCATEGDLIGTCREVLPECLGRTPGDWVCGSETGRFRCGTDLLDEVEPETCELKCVEGACWECLPGAATPPTCSNNSVVGCSDEGHWVATSCSADKSHCSGGVCGSPPSCVIESDQCGDPQAGESCCESPLVTGSTFHIEGDPARVVTVSSFRLDRFEVNNDRFKDFVEAWTAGWRPAAGTGKHTHLNDGLGLLITGSDGAMESGWDPAWAFNIDLTAQAGNGDLFSTAPGSGGRQLTHPVNFVNFYEAMAFCIWDGGFLPSAAEWSYAASGGSEQRTFPWGATVPGPNPDLAVYDCWFGGDGTCEDVSSIAPVGSTTGESLFGQLDLSGNLAEWVQGTFSTQAACVDCLEILQPETGMAGDQVHGGSFDSEIAALRNDTAPTPKAARPTRSAKIGFRCARPP